MKFFIRTGASLAYGVTALLPLSHSNAWWIRCWDFPRLQLAVVGSIVLISLLCAQTMPRWRPAGDAVTLIGVHPEPPRPAAGDTAERDAELVLVAKESLAIAMPVVVMGDLNDVAWSHTTRLFRRISSLLDPRVGRGPYPTYPSGLPFLRFPLDHVFHTRELRLDEFRRMHIEGSDHVALLLVLSYVPGMPSRPGPKLDSGDAREAQKVIEDGQ